MQARQRAAIKQSHDLSAALPLDHLEPADHGFSGLHPELVSHGVPSGAGYSRGDCSDADVQLRSADTHRPAVTRRRGGVA